MATGSPPGCSPTCAPASHRTPPSARSPSSTKPAWRSPDDPAPPRGQREAGHGRPVASGRGCHHRSAARGQRAGDDGHFTESREGVAGFDILECTDLDEATEIVAQHPMARCGRLELRPVGPDEEPG
ncbi:MAG: YciI family protein [Actinomycetota bacterium]|nr:YciI family protein [Actinomycetota bacterium]